MSVRLMDSVCRKLTKLKTGRRFLLAQLANYADDDGQGIYPSVATMASRTGQSERTVQRHLSRFLDEGILVIESDARQHRPRSYRMIFMRALELYGADLDEPRGDIMSPLKPPSRGDNSDVRGDKRDAQGCQAVSPKPENPLKKPSRARDGRETSRCLLEQSETSKSESPSLDVEWLAVCKGRVLQTVGATNFDAWLKPLWIRSVTESSVTFAAPTGLIIDHAERFSQQIGEAFGLEINIVLGQPNRAAENLWASVEGVRDALSA